MGEGKIEQESGIQPSGATTPLLLMLSIVLVMAISNKSIVMISCRHATILWLLSILSYIRNRDAR